MNIAAAHATGADAVRDGMRASVVAADRAHRAGRVLSLLALALLVAVLLALRSGAVDIGFAQQFALLLDLAGVSSVERVDAGLAQVWLQIRVPRVLLALLVGAALAAGGVALQGLFRNPLADPGLIGVASGAALGAAGWLVLAAGLPLLAAFDPLWMLPLAAFAGGLLATAVVQRIATAAGHVSVATLLLAGIAVNAVAGALTGLLTYVADDTQMRSLAFWSMGSLAGATWPALTAAAPLLLAPLLLLPRLAPALNALMLGEAEAMHLGIRVERVKRVLVVLAALAVGAAVAVAGIIGFVGLVAPHLLRLAIGPDHRFLLPGSMLLGGLLLVVADIGARTIASPAELPIGLLTALAGGPFFIWLLTQRRRA